jgi:hypothetical protein
MSAADDRARWRWGADRLTERVDARFSRSEWLRLNRCASRNNKTVGQLVRDAVREHLAVHDDEEA